MILKNAKLYRLNAVLYAHRCCKYDKVQETPVSGQALLLGHAGANNWKANWGNPQRNCWCAV